MLRNKDALVIYLGIFLWKNNRGDGMIYTISRMFETKMNRVETIEWFQDEVYKTGEKPMLFWCM